MAKPPLDSLEAVPIARLNPDIPSIDSHVVHALITLTWPYNSIKKCVAFRAAEPDFRLRQDNGQVRIQLHGPAARAVADSGLGSGDELILSLEGAGWVAEEQPSRLSGSGIKWQLNFKDKLRLLVSGDQETLKLSFGGNLNTNCIYQATFAEDGGHKLIDIPAESHKYSAEPLSQHEAMSPECEKTPDTGLDTCSNSVRNRFNDVLDGEYSSPAYLKRQRLSHGSLFEGSWEEDGGIVGKGRKRIRFGYQRTSWRLTSQSPPEEPEPEPRPRSQPKSEPGPEIDTELPAAHSRLYCPDPALRRALSGSPLWAQGSDDFFQASGAPFDATAEESPLPNICSGESGRVSTALSQDDVEKTNAPCPSTSNSDTQVTTDCINEDALGNDKLISPAGQNFHVVGSDPAPTNTSNEAASLRSDSHDVPFDRVPPRETSQDRYPLEYLEQRPFEPYTSSQSSTPPDIVARPPPPQELGNTHPHSYPHHSTSVSHGGNDIGISWAITSQPAGPEPLAEQFHVEAPVEEYNESHTSTRYQIPQLVPERPATYLRDEEDETLIWASRDALLDQQEQVEIGNGGDVEEEGESDEIEDQGADYDIRNYADVQDDEEGYEDPEFERSEECYDEDSHDEQEGYSNHAYQGEYDQHEDELPHREGLYGELHTFQQQALHNAPPRAQGSQPEVINLISDSEDEDEDEREQEGIQNEEDERVDKEEEEHGIVSSDSGAQVPVPSLPYSLPRMALGPGKDDGDSTLRNGTFDPARNYIAPLSVSLRSALAPEAGMGVSEIKDEAVEESKEILQRSLRTSEARSGSQHWHTVNDGYSFAEAEIPVPSLEQEAHGADQASTLSFRRLSKAQAMGNAAPTGDVLREESMAEEDRDVAVPSNDEKAESLVVECLVSGHVVLESSSPIAKKGSYEPQTQPLVEHDMVSDECQPVNMGAGLEVIRLDSDEEDDYDPGENASEETVSNYSKKDLNTGEIGAQKTGFEKLAAEEDGAAQEQVVTFHDEIHIEEVTKEKLSIERVHEQANHHDTVDTGREETPPTMEIGKQRHTSCPGSPSPAAVEEQPLARIAASDTPPPVEEQVSMDYSDAPAPVEYVRMVDDGVESHGSQISNSHFKKDRDGAPSNSNGETAASLSPQEEVMEQAAVDVAQSFATSTQVTADDRLMDEVNDETQPTDITSSANSMTDEGESIDLDKGSEETPSIADALVVQAPHSNPEAKTSDCHETHTENKTRQASKDDADAALYKVETASPALVPVPVPAPVCQGASAARMLCRRTRSHIQLESPSTPSTRYSRHGSDTKAGSNFASEIDSEVVSTSTRPRRRGRPPKAKPEPKQATTKTVNVIPDVVTPTTPTRRVTRQVSRTVESAGSGSGDGSINLARAAIAERKGTHQHSQSFDSVQSARVLRSSFRRSPSPEIISPVARDDPSSAYQDGSVELARASLRSRARQDVSPKRSKATPPKANAEMSSTVDKECLEKTLKKELGEYSPLTGFRKYVNREKFSGILVAAAEPAEPFRVRGGRREFLLTFPATDHSIASAGHAVAVKIYHRNRERLPIIKPGDGVLLRIFSVIAIKGKGFGLQSNAESRWVVFEKEGEGAQIRDGPVEVSDAEEKWARDQMAWFGSLDEKIKRKMEREEARTREVALEKAK